MRAHTHSKCKRKSEVNRRNESGSSYVRRVHVGIEHGRRQLHTLLFGWRASLSAVRDRVDDSDVRFINCFNLH